MSIGLAQIGAQTLNTTPTGRFSCPCFTAGRQGTALSKAVPLSEAWLKPRPRCLEPAAPAPHCPPPRVRSSGPLGRKETRAQSMLLFYPSGGRARRALVPTCQMPVEELRALVWGNQCERADESACIRDSRAQSALQQTEALPPTVCANGTQTRHGAHAPPRHTRHPKLPGHRPGRF